MKTIALLTQLLLLFLGVFLMIVVLLQRGRGGGLAGAFGGLGGQSAFGTKAGDVFTKITIVIAVAWVLVAGGSGYFLRSAAESRAAGLGAGQPENPALLDPSEDAAAGENPFDSASESSPGDGESGSETDAEVPADSGESEN